MNWYFVAVLLYSASFTYKTKPNKKFNLVAIIPKKTRKIYFQNIDFFIITEILNFFSR